MALRTPLLNLCQQAFSEFLVFFLMHQVSYVLYYVETFKYGTMSVHEKLTDWHFYTKLHDKDV